MLDVLQQCFSREDWLGRLTEMIPSYGRSLVDDEALCRRVRSETAEVLGLQD